MFSLFSSAFFEALTPTCDDLWLLITAGSWPPASVRSCTVAPLLLTDVPSKDFREFIVCLLINWGPWSVSSAWQGASSRPQPGLSLRFATKWIKMNPLRALIFLPQGYYSRRRSKLGHYSKMGHYSRWGIIFNDFSKLSKIKKIYTEKSEKLRKILKIPNKLTSINLLV